MKKTVYFAVFAVFMASCAKKNDVKINEDMLTIRVRVSKAGLDLPDEILERAVKELKKPSGVLAPNTANPSVRPNLLTIDMRVPYSSNNTEPIGMFRYFINDQDSGASATSSAFTVSIPGELQGNLFETPIYRVSWDIQFEGK